MSTVSKNKKSVIDGQIAQATPGNLYDITEFFKDNYKYIEALELEVLILLAIAYKKKSYGKKKIDNGSIKSDPSIEIQDFYKLVCLSNDQLEKRLDNTTKKNHIMAKKSMSMGIELNLEDLCASDGLDSFERSVVLLLFMKSTSQLIRAIIEDYEMNPSNSGHDGITIGILLSILSPGLVEQIKNRRYFSTEARLIKHEIIVGYNERYDNMENILNERFYLHQRISSYIVGDNNVYTLDLKCINKVKLNVDLEQVVLPEKIKHDILVQAESYLKSNSREDSFQMRSFYGYGTGLTYLFHGPSGTGKTMMANALASELDKTLLTVNMEATYKSRLSTETIIKYVFKEARLSDGIVFFDEFDDLFQPDSLENAVLLSEIEKAECITIMTTNRLDRLDPALDRRINMKVPFNVPSQSDQEKLWKALIPPTIKLDETIDLNHFAKRYVFTGGIIKNTILMATHSAIALKKDDSVKLDIRGLTEAADYQAMHLFQNNDFGKIYTTQKRISDLPLGLRDKKEIYNIARYYQNLQHKRVGGYILITSDHIETGINTVSAIASESGIVNRAFTMREVLFQSTEKELIDPLTQKRIDPIDYIFKTSIGFRSITTLIDHDRIFEQNLLKMEEENTESLGLIEKARNSDNIVFIVCSPYSNIKLPPEINFVVNIHYPSEDMQISHWMKNLKEYKLNENETVHLVEKYPMHIREGVHP